MRKDVLDKIRVLGAYHERLSDSEDLTIQDRKVHLVYLQWIAEARKVIEDLRYDLQLREAEDYVTGHGNDRY